MHKGAAAPSATVCGRRLGLVTLHAQGPVTQLGDPIAKQAATIALRRCLCSGRDLVWTPEVFIVR
jgi:hypothetical protein